MLHELGYSKLDDFISDVLPESIKINEIFGADLPKPLSEPEAIAELKEIAKENIQSKSFIGMGYYGTHTPPVILRNVLENPAWYTAYTPYQPEISQGRLEALFAFQTMITDLTGLNIANASMLDEATASAEAMTLARRNSKANDDAIFFVDERVHPQTKAVLETRAKPLGIT
ncbi:MAG: glycine dehydrogenase (aminomethyl-transferring), partial [Actinomycetales bacterium]